MTSSTQVETPVVVVGAGPVGMLMALRLAQLGTPCLLAEQNETTIELPKMDLTNMRSMEILRFMGLADEYRQLGPKQEQSDWVTPWCTGMGKGGHHLFTWPLEGNKTWRQRIMSLNDGTQPIEPPLRSSQIVLEALLKQKCMASPLITGKFGWKFVSCEEDENGVTSKFVSLEGTEHTVKSQYLVGSDGGRSAVRKHLGIETSGYNFPAKLFLTYIKSNELAERRHYGNFWHIVTPKGLIVDTNDGNLFASHHVFPEGADTSHLDPEEVVYANLGGIGEPWKFKIDEILAHSVWQPRFRCADRLSTPGGKIFLVGDAAHAVPPHGGHSMNTGILGMWNLSWKLAAVLNGYGGPSLLETYDTEMRPIAMEIIEAVGGHITRHMAFAELVMKNLELIDKETPEGEAVRARVGGVVRDIGNHGKYYGRELDQRLKSNIVLQDSNGESKEPTWNALQYTPSTWPGARAPHVWLRDGPTPIFDHYGLWWTLMMFQKTSENGGNRAPGTFEKAAKDVGLPLKTVELTDEDHARQLWEKDLVLVRPDGHVAWRSNEVPSAAEMVKIMKIISGRESCSAYGHTQTNGHT